MFVSTHLVARTAFDDDIAFVQLDFNGPIHSFLTGGNCAGHEFTLRGEEMAVVQDSAQGDSEELIS